MKVDYDKDLRMTFKPIISIMAAAPLAMIMSMASAMTIEDFAAEPRPVEKDDSYVPLMYEDVTGGVGTFCVNPVADGVCTSVKRYTEGASGWEIWWDIALTLPDDRYVMMSIRSPLLNIDGRACSEYYIPAEDHHVLGISNEPKISAEMAPISEKDAIRYAEWMRDADQMPGQDHATCYDISVKHVGDPTLAFESNSQSSGIAKVAIYETPVDLQLTGFPAPFEPSLATATKSSSQTAKSPGNPAKKLEDESQSAVGGSDSRQESLSSQPNQGSEDGGLMQEDADAHNLEKSIASHISEFITPDQLDPEDVKSYTGTWLAFLGNEELLMEIAHLKGNMVEIRIGQHNRHWIGNGHIRDTSLTGEVMDGKLVVNGELSQSVMQLVSGKGAMVSQNNPPFLRIDMVGKKRESVLRGNYLPAYREKLRKLGLN